MLVVSQDCLTEHMLMIDVPICEVKKTETCHDAKHLPRHQTTGMVAKKFCM